MSEAKVDLPPLPVEVLEQIAQNLAPTDLVSFLKVNTAFHQGAVKALYTSVPSIVLRERSTGHVHCRPPLKNAAYAKHVKCLDVPVYPLSCCRVPSKFPTLPSLEVIRLKNLCSHQDVTANQYMCPLPRGLVAPTIVLGYPMGLWTGEAVPLQLVEAAERVVVFMDLELESRSQFYRLDKVVEVLQQEVPINTRNLNVILKPVASEHWKGLTVAALFRICDRSRATIHAATFEQMRSITIVLADDAFSSASRDSILAEVGKTNAEAEAKGIDTSSHPQINILLLSEFLYRKENAHVLSSEELDGYFKIAATHDESEGGLIELLARAKRSSLRHSRFTQQMESSAHPLDVEDPLLNNPDELEDFFGPIITDEDEDEDEDVENYEDDAFDDYDDFDDDWYENYRLTTDVPHWVGEAYGAGYDTSWEQMEEDEDADAFFLDR